MSRIATTPSARRAMQEDTVHFAVQQEVKTSIAVAFGDRWKDVDPLLFPAKAQHGDYQSNVAMTLSKSLNMKPIDIANKIISSIEMGETIERAGISGPGFINLDLSPKFIQKRLLRKVQDESRRSGILKVANPQRIIVDFSSPNIAKEMHVGHLRSTIIGDSLSRVLEFLGHDVLRLNHVGDWGTQFGMLISYLKETNPDIIRLDLDAKQAAEYMNIGDLVEFYKAAKVRFDADPLFQDAARKEVVKLQSGHSESVKLWMAICEKSRAEFQGIYDLLGVSLTERGESYYNPMLQGLVQELEKRGAVVESEGAKCIFIPGYKGSDGKPLPMIVQKSDGGFLYATTDLAAVKHRTEVEKADRVIYVTDAGQAQHFAMVFEAAKQSKVLAPDSQVELIHVPFGLVLGEDGKKIKTRAGESVKLKELLNEAIRLAEESFVARSQAQEGVESSIKETPGSAVVMEKKLDETLLKELKQKAKVMGIAAVKYADLAMNRESNYKFSFNKMLSLNGNTAPYMLYAFVRIQGIKRKAAEKLFATDNKQPSPMELDSILNTVFRNMDHSSLILSEPEELILSKHLMRFDETLLDVADKLYPNKVRVFLFCIRF